MKIKDIVNQYDIDRIIAEVLLERGYDNQKAIDKFLNPSLDNLYDPTLIPYAKQAAEKIKEAALFGDQIVLFGDYDCDGITSTVIMHKTLNGLGKNINVDYIQGNRFRDGYGLSFAAVDKAADKGCDLLITMDCGIANKEEISYAQQQGIEVVVIDHHKAEQTDKIPDCTIVDLKYEQGAYSFTELCGCAVVWKVAQIIADDNLYNLLDIVAMATIADVVDLEDENRVIVKQGLERIRKDKINPGIKELINFNDIKKEEIKAHHFGFQICPMINAAGRLDKPDPAVELLINDFGFKLAKIVSELDQLNKRRQNITERIIEDVIEETDQDDGIIIYKGEVPPGIAGPVAGDLKDKFNKPAIAIGDKDSSSSDGLKGSCRSVAPLNIYNLLEECSEYLEEFGGHKMAAGLYIKDEDYDKFYDKAKELTADIEYEDVKTDLNLDVSEVNMDLVKQLNLLAPFGKGNPSPRFKSTNLEVSNIYKINGKHLKFNIEGIEVIGFNMADNADLAKDSEINIVFKPDINNWKGSKKVQLKLKDIEKNNKN